MTTWNHVRRKKRHNSALCSEKYRKEPWKSHLARSVTRATCEETWAVRVNQILPVLFHWHTLSPQTTAHFGLGSVPEGPTKPALLNLHEGMSDAVSWRSQENSEWSQSATAVHKVWISLVGGKMDFAWNWTLFIWLGSCMWQQSCSVWLKMIPQDALYIYIYIERERERER